MNLFVPVIKVRPIQRGGERGRGRHLLHSRMPLGVRKGPESGNWKPDIGYLVNWQFGTLCQL